MNTYLKFKPAWLQLVIFGSLTFGIYLSLGLIAFFGVSKVYGLSVEQLQQLSFEEPGVLSALKLLQGLLSVIIFLVPALLFSYLSDQRPFNYMGLKKPVPTRFLWLGLILMIIAFPAASWLNHLNQDLQFPSWLKSAETSMRAAEESASRLLKAMLEMHSLADLAGMLVLIALLPAICEELFFRGVLQRLFIQITHRPWLGIVITALLFSAFHGQFLGFFPRALLGILLGAIYWYSGSIWPSIIAHFVNNALQVIYVYRDSSYIDKEPAMQPVLIIFSIVAIAGLVWYMRRISHTHYGEIYDTDDELILPSREDKDEDLTNS
ncbi:CPBP family intramembrane glutamic endopeptidase [Flavihumibacter solisilvae]|uniref:CPBP family intramembrane glutamic endopeptidase n=1 Tax=Flavihumibacter solisilvae TaxID=1349421 RepID=UPI00068A0655|nr:CPBP family intramembrane glutamic endopeptidase [Flavihumibacter solisilvae]